MTWVSTSTATLATPSMYAEPCHAVSLRCDNFDIYVHTSPTTVFVLSLSRSSTPGSTTATSCSSGFLPTSNDAFRLYSMLQLVWCSDFVATITSLTILQYPRNTALVACARTSQFQAGADGVPCVEWYGAVVPGSTFFGIQPYWSSPSGV